MSVYITRVCPWHGEWVADSSGLGNCPRCEKESTVPLQDLRAYIERLERCVVAADMLSGNIPGFWADYNDQRSMAAEANSKYTQARAEVGEIGGI